MSIEIGLFMGLCMWGAFTLGKRYEKTRAQRFISSLLSNMNDDMDGKVVQWLDAQKDKLLG